MALLESLSAYRHLNLPTGDPDPGNPVVWSHVLLPGGGGSVLSRITRSIGTWRLGQDETILRSEICRWNEDQLQLHVLQALERFEDRCVLHLSRRPALYP